MKWDKEVSVEQNARKRLPVVLEKFYAAGRDVLHHEDAATLHQFRLQGKKVRYTLELFRQVYGPGLERLLKLLRKAQDALGRIQDCAAANQIAQHAGFQTWVQERQQKLHEEFRSYWIEEFDKPGMEQRWLRYLKTYARMRPALRTSTAIRESSQAARTPQSVRSN